MVLHSMLLREHVNEKRERYLREATRYRNQEIRSVYYLKTLATWIPTQLDRLTKGTDSSSSNQALSACG